MKKIVFRATDQYAHMLTTLMNGEISRELEGIKTIGLGLFCKRFPETENTEDMELYRRSLVFHLCTRLGLVEGVHFYFDE